MDLVVGEDTVPKREYVGSGDLLLDLRTPFPPPAHDIHTIRILGKEVGERLRIMAVSGLLQTRLQFVYHGFVLTPVGTEG